MTATSLRKNGHRPDYALLGTTIVLAVLGLVILASASSDLGKIKFEDSYYYVKHQIENGLVVGFIGGTVAYLIHYQRFRKLAIWILLANLVLLILVFVPKFSLPSGGASRWLRLGPLSFQPAELLKISYMLYVAAWLANPRMNRGKDIVRGLIPFFVVSSIIALLLIAQPTTSVVAILLVAGLIVYFLSGAHPLYIATLIGTGLIGFVLIIFLSYQGWISPYRWQRIQTFLHPTSDAQGTGYQINQALTAIGSGQLTGVGYGQSTAKVNRLPAPLDDSIFAVAAQELGFVGAAGLVGLFGLLVFRLFWIARHLRDRFGTLIVTGFATIIALQSIVNMGAISGLIPLTGVPLPFVSYGGTALAVFLIMIGMALNISKYTEK